MGALTRWLLGYPDQALTLMQQALALAHTLGHTLGLGMALSLATTLHLLRGEGRTGQEHAEAMLALATTHELGALATQGMLQRGWALALQGQHDEGLAQMRQGWATLQATGHEAGRLMYLALLAEQCGHAGQVEAGLQVLTEVLASPYRRGQRLCEVELYRVRGTLLLQAGGESPGSGVLTPDSRLQTQDSEAATCFQQALTLAQRQGAKSFELRAAMGLSRLWQRQGKPAEARALLGEVYGGFTEGFDTADLREATALLNALTSSP
jgi:predicted ATPase